jgi:hypothetical protein
MFWQILHMVPCIFRKFTRAREEEEHVENMMEPERRLDKDLRRDEPDGHPTDESSTRMFIQVRSGDEMRVLV